MKAVLSDSELYIGRVLGVAYKRENANESYVAVPPALHVWDDLGAQWTLGTDHQTKGPIFYFAVLRDGMPVGEYAERIECMRGKIYLYTPTGKKVWLGPKLTRDERKARIIGLTGDNNGA